jgi:hypothetical protein
MRVIRTVAGVGMLLLTSGALAGFWAYMQWFAPTVSGTIVDKQERIIGDRYAAPGRYLSTSFKLKDETAETRYLYGSPHLTDVSVDQQTYDAHMAGESVDVRYLPFNPNMARLAGQPVFPRPFWMLTAAAVVGLISLVFKRSRAAAATCVALAAAILAARPGPPAAPTILIAAIALASVVTVAAIIKRGGVGFVLPAWAVLTVALLAWPTVRGGAATMKTTTGVVRSVASFRMPPSTSHRTAITLQEFDRVHASFLPDGTTQPGFILDFVDHGSAGTLTEGSTVEVEYNVADPRQAGLKQGRRTHYWKNALIPVGAVLGLAWLSMRRSKDAKARPAIVSGVQPPAAAPR